MKDPNPEAQTSNTGTAGDSLLLSFYGDDFTGSTDAMEVLSSNGVKTALFLEIPEPGVLEKRFAGIRCIGFAGVSRSLGPAEMEDELGPVFRFMKSLGVPIAHYKICSTFDSSPFTGSIGKAIEIGREVFPRPEFVPVLAAAPVLGRYTVFGHHFADYRGQTFRLDRHPVMTAHPVTPMDESDLARVLSRQSSVPAGLLSVADLESPAGGMEAALRRERARGAGILVCDALNLEHLRMHGNMMLTQARKTPLFVAGSSGVEHALVSAWRDAGIIGAHDSVRGFSGVDRLLVVSGSCSQTTGAQIEHALAQGFAGIKADVDELSHEDPGRANYAAELLFKQALEQLERGRSLVIYTALGGADIVSASPGASRRLAGRLGQTARALVERTGLRRVALAGGDSSSYMARELGILALESLCTVSPGVPLCRIVSATEPMDGVEIAFKGGQMGGNDFFPRVKNGSAG